MDFLRYCISLKLVRIFLTLNDEYIFIVPEIMKNYFYTLLAQYLSIFIRPENSTIEIDPESDLLYSKFAHSRPLYRKSFKKFREKEKGQVDYIISSGGIHSQRDIISYLQDIHALCSDETRLILIYYSSLWKPVMNTASALGLRTKLPEANWIDHEDVDNFLKLSDFELIRRDGKILCPIWIPLVSYLVNRFVAPLPFFRNFIMTNIVVARPLHQNRKKLTQPSVSVVVAAKNEEGHMEELIKRLPDMGPDDELIIVEGGSIDNTWEVIKEISRKYVDKKSIIVTQQEGVGKGDAVRKGFSLATRDILMILDADMTVPPEDLSQFYDAITTGKGEFINGSRLVYPMEDKAMRFFNIMGNKFFALAFSFVLGQRFKDTLCGTKVMTRNNYKKLAKHRSFFGDFDPFGDFDLIFGAARLCLKIVEVPVLYRERKYGDTNISRWKHGAMLFKMLLFAARKIKFV